MLTGTVPADNGGATLTFLPQEGSPVIDAGDDAASTTASITTDQRSETRPSGSAVDIGSVEVQPSDLGDSSSGDDSTEDVAEGSAALAPLGIAWLSALIMLPFARRRKKS